MRISDWSSDVCSSDLPKKVEPGWLTLDTPDGDEKIACDVIVARLGSVAPRGFVELMGIEFTGPDREAFTKLSPTRTEGRRLGNECVSTGRSRWAQYQ